MNCRSYPHLGELDGFPTANVAGNRAFYQIDGFHVANLGLNDGNQ